MGHTLDVPARLSSDDTQWAGQCWRHGLEEVTLLVQLGRMRPGPSHGASAGPSSASIEEEENHPVWCFLRAGEDFLARRMYSHVSETAKQSG